MKITFFVQGLDSGGIENYLLRFLKETSHKFEKVYIYCKSGRGGQLESEFLKLPNIEIVKSKIGYFDYIGLNKLRIFLKIHNIDAVCDFTGNFSGLVLMISAGVGIKKRVVFYRSSTDRFKKDIPRNIYNKSLNLLVKKFATDILSNSKTALNNYFKDQWLNNDRFEVIYNGINAQSMLSHKSNLREQFNLPKNAFVIGHTGRYNPAKNHDTIISVAKKLTSKYQDIFFILCGNGVQTNLQDELSRDNLSKRIFVFENRTDIPEFLNTMDCYFFPSITEGQPNALIEAMILGLPYVASNIEPIKETVISNENLYEPNDIEAFVNALETIYKIRPSKDDNLQQATIDKFNSKNLFHRFYMRLSNE